MTEDIENIPQANQLLYTMKLRTGDELLCTLVDVQEHGLIIESPVQVKTYPVVTDDGLKSEVQTAAWMPFASTRSFFIRHADIMVINPMHETNHALYVKLVNKLEITVSKEENKSFQVEPVNTLQ